MQRNRRLAAVLVAAAVVIALVLLLVLAGGRHGSSNTPPSFATVPGSPPASSAPPLADSQRVAAILTDMHNYAFYPGAPPPKNSAGLKGGTYINWSGTWDGNPETAAANTNFGSNGQTSAATGGTPEHDEFTDLLYLRNLYGYRAAHPADQSFASDIARMDPIVRSDFSNYTYYKCSLYGELTDLDRFDPGQGWGSMAAAYAAGIYHTYYDPSRGTVAQPSKSSYRVDYSIECAVALTDAGQRSHNSAMTAAGISTARYVLGHDVDAGTHLLPLQASFSSGAEDTVFQAQVKVGDEAQILDAMLSMYTMTHDAAFLTEVHDAVMSMYSDGLYDSAHGGFYFSIDSNGTDLQTGYKETRQAWMLQVLERLNQLQPGQWGAKSAAMLTVVRDQLWQASAGGYVYRVTPSFTIYHTNAGPGHTPVTENWVTAEAMDIAGQVLEGN